MLGEGTTRFFVANRDGVIVGFAHLLQSYDTLDMTDAWILEDLFVDPTARRSGIAAALLRHAESFARSVGATRLSLSTAHTNTQRLYEAHGYKL
ncbi:MAG: GNAT family N-acetyltransferase, partial [Candidatus Eremiobacteraeota bacterium]|nr:GNAT family N-acetyltransferase [Candidatus Eremiobacteraeota bacterium]